ncbi:hypothetical protein [Leucobacter sp. wl10]|uniref:hypothetical protein n=1 Tax=Leucobacter sp. wl10 TaxID=2304677 RepID=UPI0013C338FE|nr:hypothetical protein [Leucobacter sp. wl10]
MMGTAVLRGDSAFGYFQIPSSAELVASEEVKKFVIRLTGEGDLAVQITDPSELERDLVWGPEPHTASSYGRPGDEWGMGLLLDTAGCWSIKTFRDAKPFADFWLQVADPPRSLLGAR